MHTAPRGTAGGVDDGLIVELLARLRTPAGSTTDAAVLGVERTVEELARRWRNQSEAVEVRRRWLEASVAAEAVTRRQLLAMMTAAEVLIAGANASLAARGSFAPPVWVGKPAAPHRVGRTGFEARLLGPFRLLVDDRPVETWRNAKTSRILRLLIARAPTGMPRDLLIETVWPDLRPEIGRRNLHQSIYVIRRTVRSIDPHHRQLIVLDLDSYLIDPEVDLWRDVDEFGRLARAGQDAESSGRLGEAITYYGRAIDLFGGEFLEDSPYDEWTFVERESWRIARSDLANHLADIHFGLGATAAALDETRRILRIDPCDEIAHRRAMRCYQAMGQHGLIARQYSACVDSLESSFGLRPSEETTRLLHEFDAALA